jgi:hypothetical protein
MRKGSLNVFHTNNKSWYFIYFGGLWPGRGIWETSLWLIIIEVPGSIPGHSFGFFWGSWVWNGVHSASWSDKLSSYLNKEVTVQFGKLKMQLWDSMCWPHVNPVPSGAVGKDCQRRLLSRPRPVRAVAPRIYFFFRIIGQHRWKDDQDQWTSALSGGFPQHIILTGVSVEIQTAQYSRSNSVWSFFCTSVRAWFMACVLFYSW